MHWLFLLVNHNAISNFCLNYDLQGASLEVVTEALWAEAEALKPEAEARRLKILSRRDRGEALVGLEAASRPRPHPSFLGRPAGEHPNPRWREIFCKWLYNFSTPCYNHHLEKCTSLNLIDSIFLSILMAIFPGVPGLAGTRMSPFWFSLEWRLMEVVA